MDQTVTPVATQVTCPQCQTVNAGTARFCSVCGAPLASPGAPALPPRPPSLPAPTAGPPPPPAGSRLGALPLGLGRAGARGGEPRMIAADESTAYQQACQAVYQNGGMLTWQNPPQSAHFVLKYRNVRTTAGISMSFNGEFVVTPLGPAQSSVTVSLHADWGSTVPLFGATVGILIVLAMLNPIVMAFIVPLSIVSIAWTAWAVASKVPRKLTARLFDQMHAAPGGGWMGGMPEPPRSAYAPAPPSAPAFVASPPARPAGAPPSPASDPALAADPHTTTIDQIRQLAGLRDAGAITAEEFDAKKAELLKRL